LKKLAIVIALCTAVLAQSSPATAGYTWKTYAWTGSSLYSRSLYVEHAKFPKFTLRYVKSKGRACKPSVTVARSGFLSKVVTMKPLYSSRYVREETHTLRANVSGGARMTFTVKTNGNCRTRLSVRI
jgi:hypothetical protein